MHRISHSPSGSPARKRQRLSISSPTSSEDQLGDLSQEDLEACDEIETRLSQTNTYQSSSAVNEIQPLKAESRLRDDPENPFTATNDTRISFSGFSSAAKPPGFRSASAFRPGAQTPDHGYDRSPSPKAPPELDYESWFAPAPVVPPAVFQTAKFAAAASLPPDAPIGFVTASNKAWIAPSSTALAKAKEKMDAIWSEGASSNFPITTDSQVGVENAFKTVSNLPRVSSPERPALRVLDNSFNSPGTLSPAEFSRCSSSVLPTFSTPNIDQLKAKAKAKPFKSPLLAQGAAKSGSTSFPLHPKPRSGYSTFVTAGSQHPLAASPLLQPRDTVAHWPVVIHHPIRPLQSTLHAARSRPTSFVTPFKAGMKPGEPGRSRLEEKAKATIKLPTISAQEHTQTGGIQRGRNDVFDLKKPANRQTLASCGLVPQDYAVMELEAMGIAASELKQITPALALYYSFYTPSSAASPSPAKLLGPAAALEELLSRGCPLATKLWVENHWCLILWKLAGMVFLDPERESDLQARRWCWAEVMRQLFYRCFPALRARAERRRAPPLRCIATQDAPASCPMVLCISNITWSDAGVTDDGMPIEPHPELEVTDGWYRLRAQVDAPLARAVRRGLVRVGRKIGVVGVRLSSERKEAMEVLEAYSTTLVLSGNSSHLVPWHSKLGFQISPWVATMNSLTADGGVVAAMDVVVLKAYPIAFLEFIEDENGEKQREGPRNERDEAHASEEWKRRREVHEIRYQGYVERLERRAGTRFAPSADDLYDELEDSAGAGAVLSRASPDTAGWLARFIVKRIENERERAGEEIEQELKDACTRRRGANRSAQLTVWDVLSLSTEGFHLGERYVVTNIMPTQQSAWMDCSVGSEIYLSTRRDSKWRRMS
ncbi:hypothetical protein B0H10DRAFT_2112096 [Mycena sp. CBHHK59/15]|nr:hypothetical protein B0H10DRAFT_2112096 [Mycena sp. CBHHK59/15]